MSFITLLCYSTICHLDRKENKYALSLTFGTGSVQKVSEKLARMNAWFVYTSIFV